VTAVRYVLWTVVAALGAYGFAIIAFARGETRPDTLWFIIAAVCIYAIGYRFYSRFIANRVLELDDARPTPAIISPPSPDRDRWLARCSPRNSATCLRQSGL
jgi:carbon starvation protein